MGRDVSIVAAGTKAILQSNMFSEDPTAVPIPWRDEVFNPNVSLSTTKRKLTIGWFDYDGHMPTTPCAKRAVAEARDALIKAGHELVPFTPPDVSQAWEMIGAIFTADSSKFLLNALEGETIDPSIKTNKRLMALHWSLKSLMKPIITRLSPMVSKLASSKF